MLWFLFEQHFQSWHQNGSNCICCGAEAQCCLGGLSVSFWEGSFPYQSQILGALAEHKAVLQDVRICLLSLPQLRVTGSQETFCFGEDRWRESWLLCRIFFSLVENGGVKEIIPKPCVFNPAKCCSLWSYWLTFEAYKARISVIWNKWHLNILIKRKGRKGVGRKTSNTVPALQGRDFHKYFVICFTEY